MSVAYTDAKIIGIDKETLGGATYTVSVACMNISKKALCFRKLKNQPEIRCTHPAGYRTDHPGTGACILHGGAKKTPTISTGVHAKQTRKRLQGKIDEYLEKSRDELLDLTQQLAATRAIFDEFILAFPNTDEDNYGLWFNRFNSLISTMGTLVEKISRVDARSTLTAAQVLYLRATMVDILLKYLPDPDLRERVVKEIAARMGGDMELELSPNEISTKAQFALNDYVDMDVIDV